VYSGDVHLHASDSKGCHVVISPAPAARRERVDNGFVAQQ
jgi:hypothetical protein